MNRARTLLIASLFLVPLLAACRAGDGPGEAANASAGDSKAVVRVIGTVLDAATGAPAADVQVRGPRERTSRSGADGRFELVGLRVGDEGAVEAETADGRSAKVALRPLTAGTLEVVLHLAAAPSRD